MKIFNYFGGPTAASPWIPRGHDPLVEDHWFITSEILLK